MPDLICPVCGNALKQEEKRYICKNAHSFDRAGSGYVNLLISHQSAAQHGDDRAMVRARRDFLSKGYYEPLRDALCAAALKYSPENCQLLDSGCGECYYTTAVEQALLSGGKNPDIIGIDISKDALKIGGKRNKELKLAVASAYRLPVESSALDIIMNVFAPFAGEEYLRTLKEGGVLLHASPDTNHLWELKQAVYEKPYKNDAAPPAQEGLEMIEEIKIAYPLELKCGEDIRALFHMTPYAHKTSPRDIARLDELSELRVAAEFLLRVYIKI